jgi:hypothetical protein
MHRNPHRHHARLRRLKRTPIVKRTIVTDTTNEITHTEFGWMTSNGFVPIRNQAWAVHEYEHRGRRP